MMATLSPENQPDPLLEPVGIIGSGIAGLVTAHILLQDGFNHVEVLTRDRSVGGVWCKERVYPGLQVNSVHGEFRFSPMPMREPDGSAKTGGRLSGEDVRHYMDSETFAEQFLKGKTRFQTEVLNISRGDDGRGWNVLVHDRRMGTEKISYYSRIILCTGGCSKPRYPESLTPVAAKAAGFSGPVLHSMDFRSRIDDLLACTTSVDSRVDQGVPIIVVGGGRSAQDSAAFLAREGCAVTVIFDTTDALLASIIPLPSFIRKSRFLSIMSPHKELRTRLERFLHTTWLGSAIVLWFWRALANYSFFVLGISRESPLRRTHSLFWNTRTNDEGVPREGSFHALAVSGKISLVAPARVAKFGDDGRSVILEDGRVIPAAAVILATGYESTWRSIFDKVSMEQLGLSRHSPDSKMNYRWDYASLANPPVIPGEKPWTASIYRGLVPAKSILNRDFAVNGAMFSAHHAYVCEASAHWISAFFRGDALRLPKSAEEAIEAAEQDGAWVRRRYPCTLNWMDESNTSAVAFWTWPQFVDDILEDMGVPAMRSGGNWLTWPFKAIDLRELSTLKAERDANRCGRTS